VKPHKFCIAASTGEKTQVNTHTHTHTHIHTYGTHQSALLPLGKKPYLDIHTHSHLCSTQISTTSTGEKNLRGHTHTFTLMVHTKKPTWTYIYSHLCYTQISTPCTGEKTYVDMHAFTLIVHTQVYVNPLRPQQRIQVKKHKEEEEERWWISRLLLNEDNPALSATIWTP